MTRDRGLEDLLRGDLPHAGFTEKAMFGGWAWLLDGHLVFGARDAGLLARLGKGADGWALALPEVQPMLSRGRRLSGWVRVGPGVYRDDGLRRRLIEAALAYVRGLPPK